MRSPNSFSLMEEDFFTNLPSELTTNILSRLSVRSLAVGKCVCKPWRDMFESDDFVKSHLSIIKTPPVLVRLISTELNPTRCTIFEIEDEDEANTKSNDLPYLTLADFGIPNTYSESMAAMAVNGLLLLYSELGLSRIPIIICNPITREYTELFCPEEYISLNFTTSFGFGASKLSGQYKIVPINADAGSDFHHVYPLGTGTWRRDEAGAASGFQFNFGGRIVCNGNLHWTMLRRGHVKSNEIDLSSLKFRRNEKNPNSLIGDEFNHFFSGKACQLREKFTDFIRGFSRAYCTWKSQMKTSQFINSQTKTLRDKGVSAQML
ncbi:putative F-box protein At3g16210 [Salvia splendens]|uniref:putative F-box protein At3g16210 n=1 Tax=Salvia splendens TaxID=180675 RepID=UPI001C25AD82|nr:putative F-box protein At3g16210 [Salvia splendens]